MTTLSAIVSVMMYVFCFYWIVCAVIQAASISLTFKEAKAKGIKAGPEVKFCTYAIGICVSFILVPYQIMKSDKDDEF